MIVVSGSSNQKLASDLAGKLKVKLAKVELSRFANGEARVFIKEKFRGGEAVVVQSLSRPPDEYLVEFCLICDALRRMGAVRITGMIPWLGYSKQDKVFREGEPLSVKVITKMLQAASLERIITFDLHNPAILGFFDVPVANLSAKPLFYDYFSRNQAGDLVVVAPDAGAIKSSTAFAEKLGAEVIYIDKKRDLVSGKVSICGISGKVKSRQVVMVDDLIVTGATLVETSKFLKKQGAKSIRVAATHHLYLPGVMEKLEESPIDELVVTDTIAKPERLQAKKLKILSVAGLIAAETGN